MTEERVLIEFVCPDPRGGHILARAVATSEGIVVVFPATAYLDSGSRPGTVRQRRLLEEHRQPLVGEILWGITVICSCRRPRLLTQGAVEVQLREWKKFNSKTTKPRRVVVDTQP